MSDLEGTWYIYSQKIGSTAVFKTRSTSVVIDNNNESRAGFELVKAEPVAFAASGNGYYLGASSSYTYRAQIRESNGMRLLAGHVSTTEMGRDGHPHRCVFVGLPGPKGTQAEVDAIQLPMVRIPLFHSTTTRHRSGTIDISRSGKTVLLNGTRPTPFKITMEDSPDGGIHLFSEKTAGTKTDTLEAWIIFGKGSLPICIGYHNSIDRVIYGPPTSELCTKAIIGW